MVCCGQNGCTVCALFLQMMLESEPLLGHWNNLLSDIVWRSQKSSTLTITDDHLKGIRIGVSFFSGQGVGRVLIPPECATKHPPFDAHTGTIFPYLWCFESQLRVISGFQFTRKIIDPPWQLHVDLLVIILYQYLTCGLYESVYVWCMGVWASKDCQLRKNRQ